jgi:type I restriction enzyme M protein
LALDTEWEAADSRDLRTDKHFTLKENPLKRSDIDDFVTCYNPKNRHERKESERFKSFRYEELIKRDP